jgi:hypothetical protein
MVAVVGIFLLATGCASAGIVTTSPTGDSATAPMIATQADTANGSAEACALLTKDDVAQVMGSSVDSIQTTGMGSSCNYVVGNTSIDFSFSHTGGKKAMATTLTNLGDLALVVPGLGDQAFYNTNSASALFVLKGDAEYLFNMSDTTYQPLDPAYVQKTEKGLAEVLLSHLP